MNSFIELKRTLKDFILNVTNTDFFNKTNDKRILNESTCIPSSLPKIQEMLQGLDGITRAHDFLIRKEKNFLIDHESFKNLIDSSSFNPKKEYVLENYFIKPNTFEEMNIIFNFFDVPVLKRNIVIIGDKGSGKTAAQNMWLYQNDKEIEDRKIFWVRCDCKRLYDQWLHHKEEVEEKLQKIKNPDKTELNEPVEPDSLVSINEYLSIQLLYIFAKYCKDETHTFFSGVYHLIKEKNVSFNLPISRNHHEVKEQHSLYKWINESNKMIISHEFNQEEKEENYSYATHEVMKNSLNTKQLYKRKWIAASKSLESFLLSNGYKILKILDGVDNIHINNDESKSYYNLMISYSSEFLKIKPKEGVVNLLAFRNRTYIDSCNYPFQHDPSDFIDTHKIAITPPDIKSIFLKRYTYATNKAFPEGDLYDKIASKVIEHIGDDKSFIHHNNIRSMLYNKMSLICLTYYRLLQMGTAEITDKNIISTVKSLEKRNYFLNGRLYLETINNWHELNHELGLCSMNIFSNTYRPTQSKQTKTEILCKTRILQLLDTHPIVYNNELIDFLKELFSYSEQLINNCLDDLRAFGMIDSGHNEDYYFEIHQKGKNYLLDSYTCQDSLFFFALDTLSPEIFIKRGFFRSHNNKIFRRSMYPSSAIITISNFILYLNYLNNVEKEFYMKNIKRNSNSFNIKLKSIELPFHKRENLKHILDAVSRLLNLASDNDLDILKAYANDIAPIESDPDKWFSYLYDNTEQ